MSKTKDKKLVTENAETKPVKPEPKADAKAVSTPSGNSNPSTTRTPRKPRTRRQVRFSLQTLARQTDTGDVLLAALMTAYSWNERTKLTKAEFERLRDEWMRSPAQEVK